MPITKKYKRIPTHIGIIPDGNRRWAVENNLEKQDGYEHGVQPGVQLVDQLIDYGVKEATFYAFTVDNTKRAKAQIEAYTKATIQSVMSVAGKDANIMVVGNTQNQFFPEKLLPFANNRVNYGKGLINLNFLVNYSWKWDLLGISNLHEQKQNLVETEIQSAKIPRMEVVMRWGGRRRLSGFLPVQSVYSDFFIIDDYWPDFKEEHFLNCLDWYQDQDVTLGG